MTKIAVLGANGQVGAELCLILANHRDVEVVPVCRNRAGSAFLRYHGLRCRHGLPADPAQAAALLGDCDVVVHSALASGSPWQIRAGERSLITNCLRYSKANARIIYFSTMSVYGAYQPGDWLRWRGAYGKTKLRSERLLRTASKRQGKETYILRLGHVCGPLQNIVREIRQSIRRGEVVLTSPEGPSHTVYTCTIADAVLKIAAGKERPGTYDLLNWPEWTWSEVYAYEAQQCGVPLRVTFVPQQAPRRFRPLRLLGAPLRGVVRAARNNERVKQMILTLLAHAPRALNERAQATWYRNRAQAEIRALCPPPTPSRGIDWADEAKVYLAHLAPTRDLLNDPAFRIPPRRPESAWPADLPHAACEREG
jgi:nucleoside-diphosphate-sugar epimerase